MMNWEEVVTSGGTEGNYEEPQDCLYADILNAMHSCNKNLPQFLLGGLNIKKKFIAWKVCT
jgi:hypothetical protein